MSQLALAQKEVMANLGRNIVMFQALEAAMKQLVPLFSAAGVINVDGVGKRLAKSRKKTLGQLLHDLLEGLNADNQALQDRYSVLVEQRNRLVHHFDEFYGKEFETEQGCTGIVARMKVQFEQIRELRNALRALLSVLLACLCEVHFAGSEEYADMRALCERLIAQIDPRCMPEVAIAHADVSDA